MADTFPLTVGPETFPLERQLLESPALRGSVLAELPLLPAGSTASVPRSAALFSLMLSHLRGGPLPSDVVTLRDLYVESAFYRLEGLRDAIEATLLAVLSDPTAPADAELPDTGVGLARERMLAPPFIAADHYGTRTTTVILVDRSGRVRHLERTWRPQAGGFAHEDRRIAFALDP